MSGWRSLLPRLVLLAAGCTVALVAGELVLTVWSRTRPAAAPVVAPLEQAARSVYHSSPWALRLPERTVDLPAMIEAFSFEPTFRAAANSHGFRTPEYTVARPPATFRVVVVGDSITWGQGVELAETFPERLENVLAPDLAARGLALEVIALGVCGSRLVDNALRLRAHAAALDPDLVVLQHFPNDVEYRTRYRRPELLAELGESFGFLRALRAGLERTAYWDELRDWARPSSDGWQVFAAAAAETARWREASGVPVVVLAFPPSDLRENGGNFDEYRELEAFSDVLGPPLAEMRRLGLPVLDLVEPLRRGAGRSYLCVSPADGHPNPLAHSIVARALADFLEARGMLPRGPDDVGPEGASFARERPLRTRAAESWTELNRDYSRQRELFDALLEVLPEDPWTLAQAAHHAQQSGDGERACALYDRQLALAPELAAPWYHQSLCTTDPAARRALLEHMLEVVPDHAPTVEELLLLAIAENRRDDACRLAVELGEFARYPEQLDRAHQRFEEQHCSEIGLDFWR